MNKSYVVGIFITLIMVSLEDMRQPSENVLDSIAWIGFSVLIYFFGRFFADLIDEKRIRK